MNGISNGIPENSGALVIHHFFLLATALNTLKKKPIKLATGKNLKKNFFQ
jgi:hypothetical protein